MGDKHFYVPVLTVLALAAVVILIRFFPDVSSFPVCEEARCTIQDWLAATSGWIGFGAAAIGAYFVYHQLAEQRKQTAFALGDGEPTLEMMRRSRATHSALFRVTNWNRRTLVIASLKIKAPATFIKPIGIRRTASKEPEEVFATDYIMIGGDGVSAMPRASGWLDRQKSPYTITFLLLFQDRLLGPQQEVAAEVPATIELELFFAGEPSCGPSLKALRSRFGGWGVAMSAQADYGAVQQWRQARRLGIREWRRYLEKVRCLVAGIDGSD